MKIEKINLEGKKSSVEVKDSIFSSKINEKLNVQFRKAGLSRQKIEYLNGIIFNKKFKNITKNELKKIIDTYNCNK